MAVDLFFNRNHWKNPMSCNVNTQKGVISPRGTYHSELSVNQKISAIIPAILLGIIFPVIGGVIGFYAITAYCKNKNLGKIKRQFSNKPPLLTPAMRPQRANSMGPAIQQQPITTRALDSSSLFKAMHPDRLQQFNQSNKHPYRDELKKFLTDVNYKYKEKFYDLGIEDIFGVFYIDGKNPADAQFLQEINVNYANQIQFLREKYKVNFFSPREVSRLANSDVAPLLRASLDSDPRAAGLIKMTREAILYSLSKKLH